MSNQLKSCSRGMLWEITRYYCAAVAHVTFNICLESGEDEESFYDQNSTEDHSLHLFSNSFSKYLWFFGYLLSNYCILYSTGRLEFCEA